MADAIDKTTDAVGPAEEVDTEVSDDNYFDDVEDSTEDEITEPEDTEPEAATEDEDDTDEASDTNVESEDSTQDEESEAEPAQSVEDEQRQRNQEAAQRRIQERLAKEQQMAQEQQQYLQEADDPTEQALRQLQVDAYNNRVMLVQNTLRSDITNVTADKGISELIHHENPVIRESILSALDNFEALHVTKDQYGNPTAVTGDVRQYLHAKADEIRKLTGIGALQQEKAKTTQKQRTMTPPAKTPPKAKVDPDLEAFDEQVKREY